MKDCTKDRVSSWWWNWKPFVAILAIAIFLTSLVTAVIFFRVKVEPNHPTYTYTQDEKTGLCFAHGETGGLFGGHTLTNVPCTEAVLKEISTAKE